MLLQTYLYYSCETLVAQRYTEEHEVVLYGLERIQHLCDDWKKFFAPAMLHHTGDGLHGKQYIAWVDVMDVADCLSLLEHRCCELFEFHKVGDRNAVRRRHREILFDLESLVLPSLYRSGYADLHDAQTVLFTNTVRFLTAFVPVCVSSSLSMVPAAFNENERIVTSLYLDTLHCAPSIAAAAGVECGVEPPYAWTGVSSLIDCARPTSLEKLMLDVGINHTDLLQAIFDSWRKETLRQDGN